MAVSYNEEQCNEFNIEIPPVRCKCSDSQ